MNARGADIQKLIVISAAGRITLMAANAPRKKRPSRRMQFS
jgi:hypothetical protein